MADQPKRIKNPNPPEEPKQVTERIKAGSPGSPVVLPADPETPEKKAPAKKGASKK